ncbi:MAG: monofunctional biosynthetic peptidoglycan transglycosylase [Hyphomicrobiaceae bacterium]|nr:monofunctional biosynthetic peptidoglycan transglycosylase [Hyphomicrobiaceae bacterium]
MDFDGAGPAHKPDVVTGPATGRRTGSPSGIAPSGDAVPASGIGRDEVPSPWTTQPDHPTDSASAPRVVPRHFLWRWLRRLAFLAVGLAAGTLILMVAYRFVDPPFTPIIAWSRLGGDPVDQRWVPLNAISPRLARAVIASEDARFCQHSGIDFDELKAAIEDAKRGNPRGASTITMQVVKNLFLWPSRSYLRKALELPMALALDFLWPKRRILEVYLNIAEWGPGVYGAEAAARTAYGKSAASLTDAEAARLAVSLPNPIERDPGDPDATVERLSQRLMARMRTGVPLGCLK